jgi:hypothetical protein
MLAFQIHILGATETRAKLAISKIECSSKCPLLNCWLTNSNQLGFDDVLRGIRLEERRKKGVFRLRVTGLVDDVLRGVRLAESKPKGWFWLRGARCK